MREQQAASAYEEGMRLARHRSPTPEQKVLFDLVARFIVTPTVHPQLGTSYKVEPPADLERDLDPKLVERAGFLAWLEAHRQHVRDPAPRDPQP